MCTDSVQNLPNCTQAFEKEYTVGLIEVCIMDITVHMMSSKFLVSSCRKTYKRFFEADKALIKNIGVPAYLLNLFTDAPVEKLVIRMHLNDQSIHFYSN